MKLMQERLSFFDMGFDLGKNVFRNLLAEVVFIPGSCHLINEWVLQIGEFL